MRKYSQEGAIQVINLHKSNKNDREISEITGFSLFFVSQTTRDYWSEKMNNKMKSKQ